MRVALDTSRRTLRAGSNGAYDTRVGQMERRADWQNAFHFGGFNCLRLEAPDVVASSRKNAGLPRVGARSPSGTSSRGPGGVIYNAHYVSPLSSNGYSGPIYRPADASIAIENGYPGPTSNRDERFSSRLEADLKQLGLIYDLNPTDRFAPPPLEVVSQPWQSANDSTKVRVEYFPATFQVGQKARIHVFFSFNTPFGKLEPTRSFDCAVLDVRLVSSDGRFRSQTRLGAFTFEQLAQQPLVVAHFDPWQGKKAHFAQ